MERLTSTRSANSQSAECSSTAFYQSLRKSPRSWTCTATFLPCFCGTGTPACATAGFHETHHGNRFVDRRRPRLRGLLTPVLHCGCPILCGSHIRPTLPAYLRPQRVGLQTSNPHIGREHKFLPCPKDCAPGTGGPLACADCVP